jgi:hypothetical protein
MTGGDDGAVAINGSLELQSFFDANEAVVDVYNLAGEVVELLIEAGETQVHVRTQVTYTRVLKIEAHQENDQRETERRKEQGIAHDVF